MWLLALCRSLKGKIGEEPWRKQLQANPIQTKGDDPQPTVERPRRPPDIFTPVPLVEVVVGRLQLCAPVHIHSFAWYTDRRVALTYRQSLSLI